MFVDGHRDARVDTRVDQTEAFARSSDDRGVVIRTRARAGAIELANAIDQTCVGSGIHHSRRQIRLQENVNRLVIPVGEFKQFFAFVERLPRVLRISNDQQSFQSIAVLHGRVRMIPERARLIASGESIDERLIGQNLALSHSWHTVHGHRVTLNESVPMNRSGLVQFVDHSDVDQITSIDDNHRSWHFIVDTENTPFESIGRRIEPSNTKHCVVHAGRLYAQEEQLRVQH